MKKFLHYLIQFTWGLPQNLAGFILTRKYKNYATEKFFNSHIYYHQGEWGGISLGMFIIINGNRDDYWASTTKVHEYGHTLQSLILGPLYLFIIGIPSFIWCNAKKFVKMRKDKNISYFDFYPEKRANYLGQRATKLPAPTK
ncbi:MAG: hypothetical protein GX242_00245 [Clostridiales bacterium]|nr:hypothetical protein [Clostridiales bacterium]